MASVDVAGYPLAIATTIGTIAQVGMVVAGHRNKKIAAQFAVGGMTISLLAGLLFAVLAGDPSLSSALVGGMIAGGLCALIGIVISYRLGDVQAKIIGLGTVSSGVTGLLGGWIGRFL